MTTVLVGDPARHRRAVGPVAARRLDERIGRLPAAGDYGALRDLEPGGADELVAVGALCALADADEGAVALRDALAPAGRLHFLEHVGRPGALGVLQKLSDPLWSASPLGCHVDHDIPAALRRAGLLVTDLERCTVPSAIPLLRHWVVGTAVAR